MPEMNHDLKSTVIAYLEEIGTEQAEIDTLIALFNGEQGNGTQTPTDKMVQGIKERILELPEEEWRKKAALNAMLISYKLENSLY